MDDVISSSNIIPFKLDCCSDDLVEMIESFNVSSEDEINDRVKLLPQRSNISHLLKVTEPKFNKAPSPQKKSSQASLLAD